MNILMFLALSLLFILNFACTSSESVKEIRSDLDIKSNPGHNQTGEANINNSGELKIERAATANELFVWQHSFKSPPSRKDKIEISSFLKSYDDPNIDQLLKKARNLAAIGRYRDAEAAYQTLIRLDKNLFDSYIELADLYIKKLQIDKALDYITSARSVLEENRISDKLSIFRYRYTLGIAYLASGREKEGQGILSDLIASEPGFEPAYVALAGYYLKKSKYEMADFVVKRGIDNNKKSPDLLNILGILYREKGDHLRSMNYFNEALAISSEHVPSLVNRAMLSINRQQYVAAENDFKKAIDINSSHVNAYIGLALVQARTGRYVSARINLIRAIDLDPENSYARFNLAVLLVNHLGDASKGLRLFHEVTQLESKGSVMELAARTYLQALKERQL